MENHHIPGQDPEGTGVQLYIKTGTIHRRLAVSFPSTGVLEDPHLWSPSTSTSTASFQVLLILNKRREILPWYVILKLSFSFFLTGTTANDVHYQAYLLEGIVHWNKDREVAAIEGGMPSHTYNSALRHEVNHLSNMQYGHDFV